MRSLTETLQSKSKSGVSGRSLKQIAGLPVIFIAPNGYTQNGPDFELKVERTHGKPKKPKLSSSCMSHYTNMSSIDVLFKPTRQSKHHS